MDFRFADDKDGPLILYFIRQLAEYEKMPDQVVATEELLEEWIFRKKKAEVIFVLEDGKEIGFALFVLPEYRGRGYGKALLKKLAQITIGRGCGRLEWICLDWNKPSIDFYVSMGAAVMDDWTTYRLTGDTLKKMAE